MANKFEKKEWEDRQSQHPSRRKLLPTGQENIYDVERAEGDVTIPGNAFDAQNMNDLEDRVYSAFGRMDATDISVIDSANVFTKTNVEDVLLELFTYASNGKKLIAETVGGSMSSTFIELANLIKNGKKSIASAVGETKAGSLTGNEDFSSIANFIKANKASFQDDSGYVAGGSVPKSGYWEERINANFPFTPNRISVSGIYVSFITGASFIGNFLVSNPPEIVAGSKYYLGVKDLNKSGFTLWLKNGVGSTITIFPGNFNYTIFSVPS